MSKFFQNEIAAYAGEKMGLRNVNFKKRNLENGLGAEQGTLLEIIPIHIKNPPVIQFIAYLESMSDNFKLETEKKTPFGRTDPYYVWKGNDRTIMMTVNIANSSEDIALDNLNNMSWLAACLYPTYKERMSANSIAASPLFRVRYANLVASVAGGGQGVLCTLGGVEYTHNTKEGFISIDATGRSAAIIKNAGFDFVNRSSDKLLVPKSISFKLVINVINDHAVGWDFETGNWRGGLAAPGYPYGFGLTRDTKDLPNSGGGVSSVSGDAASAGSPDAVPGGAQNVVDEKTVDELFDPDSK